MKSQLVLVTMFTFSAHSMELDEFKKNYQQLSLKHAVRVQKCFDQNKRYEKPAFVELDDPIGEDLYQKFEKDEQKALLYINGIDLSIVGEDVEKDYTNLLENNCSEDNLKYFRQMEKKRKDCFFIFDQFYFFQSLSFAIENYNWSESTKKIAKEKLFQYIDYLSKISESSSLHTSLALITLRHMANYKVINPKHLNLIIKAQRENEKRSRKFSEMAKDDSKSRNCEKNSKLKKEGLRMSLQSDKELQALLKKVMRS